MCTNSHQLLLALTWAWPRNQDFHPPVPHGLLCWWGFFLCLVLAFIPCLPSASPFASPAGNVSCYCLSLGTLPPLVGSHNSAHLSFIICISIKLFQGGHWSCQDHGRGKERVVAKQGGRERRKDSMSISPLMGASDTRFTPHLLVPTSCIHRFVRFRAGPHCSSADPYLAPLGSPLSTQILETMSVTWHSLV